jgi:hypothetical protein
MKNLNDLVENWKFELIEVSPYYFRIEGKNELGNSVSRTCSEIELDEALEKCASDARDIQKQILEKLK